MDNWAIVKTTLGTIKLNPSFESETADETLCGKLVKILEKLDNGWYFVETDYRYRGYIHDSQLFMDNKIAKQWDKEANHIITWGIIDVMKEPKFQSYQLICLTRGAVVKLIDIESNENWAKIMLPTGEFGWIRKDFIGKRIRNYDISNEAELRKNVVDIAMKYLGTQYRWGGKSPLGIDCSGLASIAYLLNGVVIYRDAKIMEGFIVKEISADKKQMGDLLFWPGHVAIYLGDDRYIHSTGAASGVVINSLNPDHKDYREDLATVHSVGSIFSL